MRSSHAVAIGIAAIMAGCAAGVVAQHILGKLVAPFLQELGISRFAVLLAALPILFYLLVQQFLQHSKARRLIQAAILIVVIVGILSNGRAVFFPERSDRVYMHMLKPAPTLATLVEHLIDRYTNQSLWPMLRNISHRARMIGNAADMHVRGFPPYRMRSIGGFDAFEPRIAPIVITQEQWNHFAAMPVVQGHNEIVTLMVVEPAADDADWCFATVENTANFALVAPARLLSCSQEPVS